MLRGVSGNATKKLTMVRKIHRENDRTSEDPSLSGNWAQESANSNNHFSSTLWFTLTAHWSMRSTSFALKLQILETAHSEGTETEGNGGRQDSFS